MPTARSRKAPPVVQLRLAIECLPVKTRRAMLEGVLDSPRIIVGAYTDREGGVCPMLAAHRHGGRTNFLSFARSWDRFTRARRRRAATRRELSILVGLLRASLLEEDRVDLTRAIAEHTALLAKRERNPSRARRERACANRERTRAKSARDARANRERTHTGGEHEPTGEILARRLRAPRWLGRRRERVSA
jgi:hypothetical protein